jgi:hypothetical protein
LALPNYSQTVDELMYSQSVWGFQPLKATDLDHLSSQTQCDYGGRIYLFRKVWMRVVALSLGRKNTVERETKRTIVRVNAPVLLAR